MCKRFWLTNASLRQGRQTVDWPKRRYADELRGKRARKVGIGDSQVAGQTKDGTRDRLGDAVKRIVLPILCNERMTYSVAFGEGLMIRATK